MKTAIPTWPSAYEPPDLASMTDGRKAFQPDRRSSWPSEWGDLKHCQMLREAELRGLRMESLGVGAEVAKTRSRFGEVSQIGHSRAMTRQFWRTLCEV